MANEPRSFLFFGGPYSNLQALLAMRSIADQLAVPPQSVICTGDMVAYCAQPRDTVALIRDWGIQVVAGNVELQLAAEKDDCGCNFNKGSVCDLLSAHWYAFANAQITPEQRAWMRSLPTFLKLEVGGRKIGVVHGSRSSVSEFIFRSTSWDRKLPNFKDLDCDVIVGGHCGIPFLDETGDRLWVNAGVIGMPPNDGTPRGWYLHVVDREADLEFSLRPFEYDVETAARLMEDNSLPCEYSSTLRTGLWSNMDILPDEERSHRGQALSFSPIRFPKSSKLEIAARGTF